MTMCRFLLPVLLAGAAIAAEAQPAVAPAAVHRVVFQLQAEGEERWHDALNNLDNLLAAFGAERVRIDVVAHGAGAGC
jgi:hypothetical protein